MKKKILIIGLSVLVFAAGGVLTGTYVAAQAKEAQREEELREQNSKADITEVFHDQANEYFVPLEPTTEDDITVRIRTERYNVTKAQIQYTTDQGASWQLVDMSFEKHDDTGYYDFWVGTIPAQEGIFYYRFICANETSTRYVDASLYPDVSEQGYSAGWCVSPGYHSPDWAKGALWYNLMPDAFYNGDVSGDTASSDGNDINSWNHVRHGLSDKYGGDLKGVAEKIEHFKELYVDAVFMNPFNRATQNAGYGPLYYNQVEPTLGNAQTLKDTLAALHDNGFKVGSDAVLTFTPQQSIYFDSDGIYPEDGAHESEDSIYKDMYVIYDWPSNYHITWSGVAIDNNTEIAQKILFSEKDSYLQYYTAEPFGMDSWRFDCGGWLWGRTEERYLGDTEVLSSIKKNLQEINPEIFLVSENSGYNSLISTVWGAHWNFNLANGGLRGYMEGSTSEENFVSSLKNTLNIYPRPIALSFFNLAVTHDNTRQNEGQAPSYMERAGHLVLMTYIGSPSIYYGDEVNLERQPEEGLENNSNSFYAMEWDESNWDYERYNMYKALGELRSKYSALKTGAIRNLIVDNDDNLYAFGRWDDNGTVITVASQNKETVTVDVNARLLSVADGTLFTDWLTGKQYTVDEDGMLHLEVVPGGSVFVTGKEASKYRNDYTVTDLKRANAEVYWANTDKFELEGNGSLGKADKITLAATDLYGAGSIYAVADGDGQAVLTVRQEASAKAPAYNVTLEGGKLTVTARTEAGGKLKTICEATYESGSAVRINRSGANTFTVSTVKLTEAGEPAGDWSEVKGSEATVPMEYQAVAGFAPIKGNVTLSHVTKEEKEAEISFDDFESGNFSAMFDYSDGKNASVENGTLVLNAKDGVTWANTQSRDADWTFKVKLDSAVDSEGSYAGVWSMSDANQWVAAGRTVVDGEALIFVGRTTDGTMQIDSYVKDTDPKAPVVLQLQRIGSMYTVAYSYDEENYAVIDDKIFANFSSEHVGAFAAGKTKAVFDYASFGDSIHDGNSENTPYASGVVDVDYSDSVEAVLWEKHKVISGTWEYGAEGYYQSEKTGVAQMGFAQKVFKDFKVNVTLQLEDGEGYAAVGFGKTEHDSDEKDGFLLKYTRDNKLILMKNGVKMASVTVKEKDSDALRLIIEVKNSNIKVYAGQNASCIMSVENTGYEKGYVAFYSVDTAARFMNHRLTSLSADWSILSPHGAPRSTVSGGSNSVTCQGSTSGYGAITLQGVGVTDFVTSLTIQRTESKEAGVLLCAYEGASKVSGGISVALVEGGKLVLQVDGEIAAQYELGEEIKSATIMVTKKDRIVKVYVKGVADPVITYEDTYNRGGSYQLYATTGASRFIGFGLEDIHNINVEESKLYKLWQNGELYSIETKTYRENFNSLSGWESLGRYHSDHGTWEIKDGVLACTASPNWASGVNIYDRLFSKFNMEFKYRYDDTSTNFVGVLFHKQGYTDTNGAAGHSLLLYPSGEIALYAGTKHVGSGKIANFEIGNWYQLKVVSTESRIRVYYGNECLIDYAGSELSEANGFLSFTANRSLVSFDDVLIEPID